eukprot:scpid96190/ scgid20593/ 
MTHQPMVLASTHVAVREAAKALDALGMHKKATILWKLHQGLPQFLQSINNLADAVSGKLETRAEKKARKWRERRRKRRAAQCLAGEEKRRYSGNAVEECSAAICDGQTDAVAPKTEEIHEATVVEERIQSPVSLAAATPSYDCSGPHPQENSSARSPARSSTEISPLGDSTQSAEHHVDPDNIVLWPWSWEDYTYIATLSDSLWM